LSAQTCELFSLSQALKFLKDKEGMIYMHLKYAFRVAHTFGKIWTKKALINSKGQDLVHKELIIRLLETLMLPEEIAIVHVLGHHGISPGAQGNNLADKAAKNAALHPEIPMLHLSPILETPSLNPAFTPQKKVQLMKLGTSQTSGEKSFLPDRREVFSNLLCRR
jgi:ribonuclease HI